MKASRQVILGGIAALALFYILGFVLQWNLFVVAALSIATYFGVYLIAKPKMRIGNLVIDNLPQGDELRALMDDAYGDMEAIRKASLHISNVKIKEESQRLYNTGSKILEYLSTEPDKIRLARRFFTYYLDTARDILEKYQRIQSTQLRSQEVSNLTRSTEDAMPVLNQAFEKQFSNLMANDILDIEEDIKLLKINLKMDT